VQDDDDGLLPGRSDPLSGVPDAVFVHSTRFYASAGSRDGILAMAALGWDGVESRQ